jgi:predicted ThiF/HesA family dinucleotide-utilizing enzyme
MFINNFIKFVNLIINILLFLCSLQLIEMGRKGYSRIAFMDPSKVNTDEIKNQRKTTVETIFRHLDEFHYKNLILLPYNFK